MAHMAFYTPPGCFSFSRSTSRRFLCAMRHAFSHLSTNPAPGLTNFTTPIAPIEHHTGKVAKFISAFGSILSVSDYHITARIQLDLR